MYCVDFNYFKEKPVHSRIVKILDISCTRIRDPDSNAVIYSVIDASCFLARYSFSMHSCYILLLERILDAHNSTT